MVSKTTVTQDNINSFLQVSLCSALQVYGEQHCAGTAEIRSNSAEQRMDYFHYKIWHLV